VILALSVGLSLEPLQLFHSGTEILALISMVKSRLKLKILPVKFMNQINGVEKWEESLLG
jgi:hypothetical protein